jgi:hypothetical protein
LPDLYLRTPGPRILRPGVEFASASAALRARSNFRRWCLGKSRDRQVRFVARLCARVAISTRYEVRHLTTERRWSLLDQTFDLSRLLSDRISPRFRCSLVLILLIEEMPLHNNEMRDDLVPKPPRQVDDLLGQFSMSRSAQRPSRRAAACVCVGRARASEPNPSTDNWETGRLETSGEVYFDGNRWSMCCVQKGPATRPWARTASVDVDRKSESRQMRIESVIVNALVSTRY